MVGRFLNADIHCDTLSGSPLSTNMYAYCENNEINYYDSNGFYSKKINLSLDLEKIPSSKKVYVIYYESSLETTRHIAKNFYNYNAKSKNTIFQVVTTKNDFIAVWNGMTGKVDHVFIFVHGGYGFMVFSGGNRITELSSLKKKKISSKVWLMSCNAATGGYNSLAAKFSKLLPDTTICGLSTIDVLRKKNGVYYAGNKAGHTGYWMWYRYVHNGRGKYQVKYGYYYK